MRRRVMTGPKSLDVLYTYTYNSNNYHTFVAPKSAYYYVECWGGQGNYGYNDSEDRFTRSNDPGYGGYVAGFIKLVGGDIIYVYCGNGGLKQTSNVVKYNYNGGGSGHSMTNESTGRYIYEGAGGGATDLRLSNNSDPLNVDSWTNKQNVQQLRFIPKNGYIMFEIVYNKKEKGLMYDNGNYLGIDLGLNNLASCVSNTGSCFIINGKPLKSINQYYNKRLAYLKSKLKGNKQVSRQIRSLTNKRNNKIKDYLHKASRVLINHVVSNGINTIVIGHNRCWKQEINIGKRNNQNFVSIPFNMFISMISYKATLEGINVKIVEESYTSKCSFLDNEQICKHEGYAGRRIKRGLFKTSSGSIINADINAAFNIIRKSAKEAFDVSTLPGGRGFWWNPVRISV